MQTQAAAAAAGVNLMVILMLLSKRDFNVTCDKTLMMFGLSQDIVRLREQVRQSYKLLTCSFVLETKTKYHRQFELDSIKFKSIAIP